MLRILSSRKAITLFVVLFLSIFFSLQSSSVSAPVVASVPNQIKQQIQAYLPKYTAVIEEELDEPLFDQLPEADITHQIVKEEAVLPGHRLGEAEGKPFVKQPVWDLTRKDGRLLVPNFEDQAIKHPIPDLMRHAKKQWQDLQDKQSKTFAQTVAEYTRRTGRKPPKGFDAWYAFAKANKARLIDEFDLVDYSLRPFFAFSPTSFRNRVEYVSNWHVTSWAFGIRQRDGRQEYYGEAKDVPRANDFYKLLKRFKHVLPDFTSYHTAHDGPHIWRNAEERERLLKLVEAGEFDPQAEEEPLYESHAQTPPIGPMPQTCPLDSPMREEGFIYGVASKEWKGTEMSDLPGGTSAAFVRDAVSYLDVCQNPQFRHTHSATSWTFPLPGPFLPIFSPGVLASFGDIRSIITEQWEDNIPEDRPFSERTDSRLVWRGQTSGPQYWSTQWPWKSSHRARLHLLAQEEEGSREIILADAEKEDVMQKVEIPNRVLNAAFLDVGMIGPAVQCDIADGTCDEMKKVFHGYKPRMSQDVSRNYRFELDVDGNSWSGRFRRLMLSSVLVLKATIFREYWSDSAIPWLHYVPVSVDYSDLWNILSFFRGGLYGENAHLDLAEEIAQAGQDFAKTCLRYEDMEIYMFRLYIEYCRLYAEDREEATFTGDVTHEPKWEDFVPLS